MGKYWKIQKHRRYRNHSYTTNMKETVSLFWLRRDLRLHDNAALFHAIQSWEPVMPIFIFDHNILDKLKDTQDARVAFIHDTTMALKKELRGYWSDLHILYGNVDEIFQKIFSEHEVGWVYVNHDYEPQAIARDKRIEKFVSSQWVTWNAYKDQVIFEKSDVTKADWLPYTVYTPYKNKWKELFKEQIQGPHVQWYKVDLHLLQEIPQQSSSIKLEDMWFSRNTTIKIPDIKFDSETISKYEQQRDYPGINAWTSRLWVHLRFWTVSARECVRNAIKLGSEVWLSELIWREFFMQILYHFPHTVHDPFYEKYWLIQWRDNEDDFEKWCTGNTWYPMVDAGMRELNATWHMHNRVRMVVASFLTKHLLIHWKKGERYFAEKLLDYDLSANVGNWQWAAGCWCDAAPYFRVFNPELQMKKFDKEQVYIRKWVSEVDDLTYVPMVDHKMARERVLSVYKEGLDRFEEDG